MPTPSPEIQAFAAGFPVFLAHAGVTVVILFAAAALYILLTPHREITLIREGNTASDTAAAVLPSRMWVISRCGVSRM